VSGSSPIDPQLADVATVLRCLSCGASAFAAAPDALTCGGCGALVPVVDGIPHVRIADEDAAISRERQAVAEMEATPLLRPTDFSLASLLADGGPLLEAFSSLPYDDGSAFYRENDYFQNVARFADVFDYAAGQLGPSHGGRLLDVGADLTWSTARLAARGWRAVGIDINDHLRASQALRRRGPAYAAVNADMHLPAFREGAFDAITAFNALHHTHRLEALIASLVASLRPGGRLCVVEPYWYLEEVRQAFGAAQIEAGINENVYRLEEWHRWFVQAGLELASFLITHSYNAVYVKRAAGVAARTISLAEAEAELFDRFYDATLVAPAEIAGPVPAGTSFDLPVTIVNRGPAGWSSEGQLPVRASYHLYKREGSSRTRLAFGLSRTPFEGFLLPGGQVEVRIRVAVPETPGDYDVEIDLVHEMRTWFSERGSAAVNVRLHVVEPTA
jgi:SAM-dependent methyltransferase